MAKSESEKEVLSRKEMKGTKGGAVVPQRRLPRH